MAAYSTSYLGGDFYKVLGIKKTALPAEVKKAYRELSNKYHPDHAINGITITDPQIIRALSDRFAEIEYAFSILSDTDKRKTYDMGGEALIEAQRTARMDEVRKREEEFKKAEEKIVEIKAESDIADRLIQEALKLEKEAIDTPFDRDRLRNEARAKREEADREREKARKIDQEFARKTREEETKRGAEGKAPGGEDDAGTGDRGAGAGDRGAGTGDRGTGTGDRGTGGWGRPGDPGWTYTGRSGRTRYFDEPPPEPDEPDEPRGPGWGERFGNWAREKAENGAQRARNRMRNAREGWNRRRDEIQEGWERVTEAAGRRYERRTQEHQDAFNNRVNTWLDQEEQRLDRSETRVRVLGERRRDAADRANIDGGTHGSGGGEAKG